jgi:hypothetical protein
MLVAKHDLPRVVVACSRQNTVRVLVTSPLMSALQATWRCVCITLGCEPGRWQRLYADPDNNQAHPLAVKARIIQRLINDPWMSAQSSVHRTCHLSSNACWSVQLSVHACIQGHVDGQGCVPGYRRTSPSALDNNQAHTHRCALKAGVPAVAKLAHCTPVFTHMADRTQGAVVLHLLTCSQPCLCKVCVCTTAHEPAAYIIDKRCNPRHSNQEHNSWHAAHTGLQPTRRTDICSVYVALDAW